MIRATPHFKDQIYLYPLWEVDMHFKSFNSNYEL